MAEATASMPGGRGTLQCCRRPSWHQRRSAGTLQPLSANTSITPLSTRPTSPSRDATKWWLQKRAELSSGRDSWGLSRGGSSGGGSSTSGSSIATADLKTSTIPPQPLPNSTPASISGPSKEVGSSASTASSGIVWIHGGLRPASQDLAAAVAPLAALCGADGAALARAVACLPPGPLQQRVIAHGCQVAHFLLNLGCERALLSKLLLRCLPLFSAPPEDRAAPLLAPLLAAGLLPCEAARCLERCPMAAGAASFQPALEVLVDLLQAGEGEDASIGSDGGGSSSSSSSSRKASPSTGMQGQQPAAMPRLQPVGQLLRAQPEAAALLRLPAGELSRRADHLQSLGLDRSTLAGALRRHALLLEPAPEELDERAEVLEEELGGGPAFFAALLAADPAVLSESDAWEVLQPHAAALAEEFGRDVARAMVAAAPQLLAVPPASWRTALATLALSWVADPRALVQRCPQLLCAELASQHSVAARLAIQLALHLSAAQVYESLPGCACRNIQPGALAFRLHLLQSRSGSSSEDDCGQGSTGDGRPGSRSPGSGGGSGSCRRVPAAGAAGISMHDVCSLPDVQFAFMLRMTPAELAAGQAQFESSTTWIHLLEAAGAEAARLQCLLQLQLEG